MSSKRMARWLMLYLALLLAAVVALAGCGGEGPDNGVTTPTDGELKGFISITGSNTVTPLTSVWAEEFMAIHPRVSIAVSGPGTGVGIAALINGTTDICQASRKIREREVELAEANGVEPYEIQVALDALTVIVHPANPISELTLAQLSAIYTNGIGNWREVGGEDRPIVALSRDTNSGTHVFFKEQVVQMKGLPTEDKSLEYGPNVLMLPSTHEGVSEVARNPNAIFYPGLGYVSDEVKTLAIKKTAGDAAVLPSVETTLDGTYPIARPLLYYTDGEPDGIVGALIEFCLSPEGQGRVVDIGYVPLE